MVAYNLALALFPFALLVLFVFGKILQSGDIEQTRDQRPAGACSRPSSRTSCKRAVERVRDSSTTIGIAAAIGAIWIGASFWGAMDTAFCRIYHVECRSWLAQKRFALVMLLVVSVSSRRASSCRSPRASLFIERRRSAVRPRRDRGPRNAVPPVRGALPSPSLISSLDLLRRPEGPRALARGLARSAVRDDRRPASPTPSSPLPRRRSRTSTSSAARSASSCRADLVLPRLRSGSWRAR